MDSGRGFRLTQLWAAGTTVRQSPDRDCHDATVRILQTLPLPEPDGVIRSAAGVQRRWIRAKCDRCRKCPEMVS